MSSQSSEQPYLSIARRKQDQLDACIPPEWRLPAHLIPQSMLSPADSITRAREYGRVTVIGVPRTCGLLTSKEIEITEKWDAKGLLEEAARGRLSAEEVATAFCKVSYFMYQVYLWLSQRILIICDHREQLLLTSLRVV